MHSMVIEADMGNYGLFLRLGNDTRLVKNLDCCTCTKETGMGADSRGELGEICGNPTATSEVLMGAVLVKRRW
jgi:hypothetical protein